ncbi:MAG: response regulator [Candidatus Omnitrophica bacterium]|nr:response regulator [Candidatus Omnitrophota bacterium]
MRILVIDDDYVSRLKLKTLLSEYGDCDAVPSGEIGLQMFDSAKEEAIPYDLVTVDINMPGMRGPEIVKAILKRDVNNVTKTLMVTGVVEIGEIADSFRENCDWCLRKPVNAQNIEESLKKIGIVKR